jgi:hypothetical protein
MKKQGVELTRQELYDEVWSAPMTKLAKKYGLSDVGVVNMCKQNNIPRPPRGYWNKLEAGKKVYQYPLPPIEEAKPIRLQTSVFKIEFEDSYLDTEAEKLLAFELLEANRITIDEEMVELHPFTKAVVNDRRWKHEYLTSVTFDVEKPYRERATRIADALIRAMDARGFLKEGIFEQKLSLEICEIYDTELKESAKQRMQENGATRADPCMDYYRFQTGRLRIKGNQKNYFLDEGIRRSWGDGKTQRIEAL